MTITDQTSTSPATGRASSRFGDTAVALDTSPAADAGPEHTYLEPDDLFPLDLSGVPTGQLHILNSRVCRQRDREYLTLEGPHSQTAERFHQLQAELDERQTCQWSR